MKKLLLFGFAAAMLTACSNDETLEVPQSNTIGFSTFVDNSVRSIIDPSYTKETLGSFAVYGFTDNGQIFDGTEVSGSDNGSTWTYSPLQYWITNNTYTFGAIAPADVTVSGEEVKDGAVAMSVSFTNDGETDLLHAAPSQITATEGYSTPVSLTFKHQLSKVKFSFENAVGEGYNVKVTNINITNAKETGTLNVASTGNAWSNQNGSFILDFGNIVADDATDNTVAVIENGSVLESYNELLMIPTNSTVEYAVTFTAELLQGEVSLGTYDHNVTIKDIELQLGYCYDFKATLNIENITGDEETPQPITFEVSSIENWNKTNETQELEVSK